MLLINEMVAPAAPSAGKVLLYAKADGLLYSKDDAGNETLLSQGPAVALTSGTLAQFSSTTSAELRGIISDELGSGALIFDQAAMNLVNASNLPATGLNVAAAVQALLASFTSANLRSALSDETGTGSAVFANAPTLSNIVHAAGAATAGNAPVKFTSGPVLTTPEAGAVEFENGIMYATQDTTLGRGQNVIAQTFRLSASGASVGPAVVDLFGANSAIPLEASSCYEIVWEFIFAKTTAGTLTLAILASGNINSLSYAEYTSTAITGMQATAAKVGAAVQILAAGTTLTMPVTGSLSTAVYHKYTVRAVITTTNAVNVRLRGTQSAGTLNLMGNSTISVRKLPLAGVGNFVA